MAVPTVVSPNDYAGKKSNWNKLNSVHPMLPSSTVTTNNMNVTGEVKKFMERYQKSLTPASLPLYFYIAYQFIQENSFNAEKTQVSFVKKKILKYFYVVIPWKLQSFFSTISHVCNND